MSATIFKFCHRCLVHCAIVSGVLLAGKSEAATNHLANLEHSTFTNAVALASAGDTLILPAGSNSWPYLTSISKPLSIIGQGKLLTIIHNGTTNGETTFLNFDQTDRTKRMRLAHLQITGGTNGGANSVMVWQNDSYLNDIDGVFFNWCYAPRFAWFAATTTNGQAGLFHNCDLYIPPTGQGFYIYTVNDQNISHIPWARAVSFTNEHHGWWFQSNRLSGPVTAGGGGTNIINHFSDGNKGVSQFWRWNFVTNGSLETHEQGGLGDRGHRAFLGWGNTHVKTNAVFTATTPYWIRTGLFYGISNHTIGDWIGNSLVQLNYQRATDPFVVFGQANGTNEWDTNDSTVVMYGGTHTGGENVITLEDSTKSWAVDELVGRHVIHVGTGKSFLVLNNTATTITPVQATIAAHQPRWTNGNPYIISNRLDRALDQTGVGHGVLLTGGFGPAPDFTPFATPVGFPHTNNDIAALWGNTGSATNYTMSPYQTFIIAGRDVTNKVMNVELLGEHSLDMKDMHLVYQSAETTRTIAPRGMTIRGASFR